MAVFCKNVKKTVIYFADASELEDDKLFSAVYGAVSDGRRQKADRYRFKRDKNLSLCAEYLLMCGCEDVGIDYVAMSVVSGKNGKPRFADGGICFNLSHSGEKAMCAMAQSDVGCDIEKIGVCNTEVAERCFSEEELAALFLCDAQEEKDALFYRIWTLKESIVKCTGAGMSVPLNSFSAVSDGRIKTLYRDGADSYMLSGGTTADGYQYALCIKITGAAADCETLKKEICIFNKSVKAIHGGTK